jgi:formylglycine-generating enzyme required for sulfatase activity
MIQSATKHTTRDTVAMVEIPGGTFVMGSDRHYPEEAPAHRVKVDGFLMDATPVTNDRFRAFVDATRYVTTAERAPNPKDYPGALPEMMRAGSLVFTQPETPAAAGEWGKWWSLAFGADWRHPTGPGSDLAGLGDHPVVHVTWDDAAAFAKWAGKALPTEAEWERAARGTREGAAFAWGDELTPDGRHLANTWQGTFPNQNLLEDGFARTSPVGAFPANDFGLYDLIGNVWEWTADWYADRHIADALKPCCIPSNPRGGLRNKSLDPCDPSSRIPRKVLKGGSHLCAPNYCQRYRPAARYPQPIDTSTSHVGFRCIRRLG